jgi:hypothetical protein
VIGFAPNHGAQANDGSIFLTLGQTLGDERNLKATGHADDIDIAVGDAVLLETFDGAGDELIDDDLIKTRGDYGETAGGSCNVTFDEIWHTNQIRQ